jgi:hypothetical protein
VPNARGDREFESTEDVCNQLLGHPEVLGRINKGVPGGTVLVEESMPEALQLRRALDMAGEEFAASSSRARSDSRWRSRAPTPTRGATRARSSRSSASSSAATST